MEGFSDFWVSGKKIGGLLDGHIQDITDGLAIIFNLKSLAVESTSRAILARHERGGKEVHF
jgi:hypothetical protein